MSLFNEEQLDTGGAGCYMCRLWRYCKSPKIAPQGYMEKKILILLDSPTSLQDKKGKIDVGDEYKLLEEALREEGINIWEDCRVMFAACCRTRNGGELTEKTIDLCRSNVWTEIRNSKPNVIILCGILPLISVIGKQWKRDRGEFSAWVGLSIPDKNLNAWLVPVYNPAELVVKSDQYKDISKEIEWKRQLKKAIKLSNKKIPADTGVLPNTDLLFGDDRIRYLKLILDTKPKYLAFDYETNCLKPQLNKSRIYSIGIATDSKTGVAMPFDDSLHPYLCKLFGMKEIGKIASNMKFEDIWTRTKLGVPVRNWVHDTMLFAHVEDNRPLYSGLKKQVFIHFGVPDYAETADRYLHSSSLKQLNTIHEMNETDLLTYNALDAVFEYKLAMLQRKAFV